MSRRERLWISMLLVLLAAPAVPAHAAEGPWQGLEGLWSWWTEGLWSTIQAVQASLEDQCAGIDPNGRCGGRAITTSEQGFSIDPNGGSTATSEQSLHIDPNG